MTGPLLEVSGLSVEIGTERSRLRAVEDVSFTLEPGSVLAVVGESGSGKTLTARSLIGLVGPNIRVGGSARYEGTELVGMPERQLRAVRGNRIGLICQDAMTAMNPVLRIGDQIVEAVRAHAALPRAEAEARAVQLLREVGIGDPDRCVRAYPHQLSGGMRQRALIAMSLACEPELLIADEPTTALDVTVQAQVLELLKKTVAERRAAMIFITHDLGLVAEIADEVMVMYAGRVVERGATEAIFRRPRHPYTRGLLESSPRADRGPRERMETIEGGPPPLGSSGRGCAFRPRCPAAFAACEVEPELRPRAEGEGHLDRCWLNDPAVAATRDVAEEPA